MLEFNVENMTCGHCVASITKAVKTIEPDADLQADLETHRIKVVGTTNQDAVLNAITDAGFIAHPV